MKFSVVIPSYNSGNYIEDTIQSLAGQTYIDFEVIIVDDNSSDDSFLLAKRLISRFGINGSVIKKPKGSAKGVSAARNFGVDQASGDWILFLDSDDLFHSRKIEFINKLIAEKPSIDFFYHPVVFFDEEEKPNDIIGLPLLKDKPEAEIYDENFVVTSSVSIKKSVFCELGGFSELLNGVEDYHLWLKIFDSRSTHFLPNCLTFYRIRYRSLMNGRKLTYYVNQNLQLVKRIDFLSQTKVYRVKYYLFDRVMNYYSNSSIRNYGFGSFISGVFRLLLAGYIQVAFSLFISKSREFLLRQMSRVIKL